MKQSKIGDHCWSALGCAVLASLLVIPATTPRLAAATVTVNNRNDNGPGSLRRAIQNAGAGDTIGFSIAGTITLTSGELLVNKSLTIAGPGASVLAVSGHTNSRVFEISSNATVSISGLMIRDGHAADGAVVGAAGANGGGIYNAGNLTLTGCGVLSNTAGAGFSLKSQPLLPNTVAPGGAGGHGGGIYNLGTLRLVACTVGSNTGGRGGRSWNSVYIHNVGGAGGLGGGVYNAGAATLSDCTVSGNTGGVGGIGGVHLNLFSASHAMAGGTGGAGGGVFNAGTLTVIACTLSANAGGAGGTGGAGTQTGGVGGAGGSGGAIYNATNASVALRSSLQASNQAGAGGTGGTGSTTAGAPGTAGSGPDLYGSFTSQGHNLLGQADGSSGLTDGVNNDLVGSTATPLNPGLGPLQNNGGNTSTMPLLSGSPALEAGDDALLGAPFNLATDQRGLPRKSGAHVDIGAFEYQEAAQALAAEIQPSGWLVKVAMGPNRALHFTIAAPPGTTGTVEASSDLTNWTALWAFATGPDGICEFSDETAPAAPQRFYRLRRP